MQRGDRCWSEFPHPRGCREVKAAQRPGVAVHRRWLVSGFRALGSGSRRSRVRPGGRTARRTESTFSVWERCWCVGAKPGCAAETYAECCWAKLNRLKQVQLFILGVTTAQLAWSELDLSTSVQALCGRSCLSFSVFFFGVQSRNMLVKRHSCLSSPELSQDLSWLFGDMGTFPFI